jgi:hypothetical protein
MPRLPNCEQAIIDIGKIEDHCLSSQHPRGRHKARLFGKLLGITRLDAKWLRDRLLDAMRRSEAIELKGDVFGKRWRVDITVARHERKVVVRTIWIVRTGEDTPRFVTCWIV